MLKPMFAGVTGIVFSMSVVPGPGSVQAADVGKQQYVVTCAVCHGDNGKGHGPLGPWLKIPAADLTTIQKNNNGVFPFDRVYEVIDGRTAVGAHGPRDMPVWGEMYSAHAADLPPQERDSYVRGRIVALVGYIYSLQEK